MNVWSAMPSDHVTRLEDTLKSGKFVLTAEITPPVSCDKNDLLDKALPLRGLADAVNVTDGAGASVHLAAVTAATLLRQAGIEPILQLTCRDRNRIALQSELVAAAAVGVRNVLLLTGDKPDAGDQPDAKPVFDLDSLTLMATARTLRDQGQLPNGRKVGGSARFFIGAADLPIDPPAGWKPDGLKRKLAAGAEFVQTQFCMDAGVVRRYAARLADEGVSAFLLIGIAPLRSARSAHWMRQHLFGTIIPETIVTRMEQAADARAEGQRICVELLQELADIKGVAGAHIMAPNNEAAVPDVMATARQAMRQPRA